MVRDKVKLNDACFPDRLKKMPENQVYWTNRWAEQMNFPYWRQRSEAEMDSTAVAARQLFYEGTKAYKTGDFDVAALKFKEGLGVWKKLMDEYKIYRDDEISKRETGLIVKRYVRVLTQKLTPIPADLPFKDNLKLVQNDNTVDPFDTLEMIGPVNSQGAPAQGPGAAAGSARDGRGRSGSKRQPGRGVRAGKEKASSEYAEGLSRCGRISCHRSEVVFALAAAGGVYSHDPLDGTHELFHGERLANVVAHPEHLGVSPVSASLVSGNHDGGDQPAGAAPEFLEDEKPAFLGHHHVEDDEVGVFAFGDHQTGVSVARGQGAEPLAFEHHPHRFDDLVIVVDEENRSLLRGHGGGSSGAAGRGESRN